MKTIETRDIKCWDSWEIMPYMYCTSIDNNTNYERTRDNDHFDISQRPWFIQKFTSIRTFWAITGFNWLQTIFLQLWSRNGNKGSILEYIIVKFLKSILENRQIVNSMSWIIFKNNGILKINIRGKLTVARGRIHFESEIYVLWKLQKSIINKWIGY